MVLRHKPGVSHVGSQYKKASKSPESACLFPLQDPTATIPNTPNTPTTTIFQKSACMLVEQREEEELCELQQSGKRGHSKSKKNRKKSKKAMVSVVQKLFETCKQIFADGGAGVVPSPDDVQRLRSVLDGMKPEDVGLTQDMPYFRKAEKRGAPFITYLHVYECNKFSIGIFCLPPSGIIPLHNHPGMTVFSKLLFGSMHIKSYDWVTEAPEISKENLKPSQRTGAAICDQSNGGFGSKDFHIALRTCAKSLWKLSLPHVQLPFIPMWYCGPPQPLVQPAGTRLAMVNTDSVFTAPCKTSILYPAAGGNMHCFTALTSCAVLDVLGPPYCDSEGRECVYYGDIPCANFSGVPMSKSEKNASLEERERTAGALRGSNVLPCAGDVGDIPTSESEKNVLPQEKEETEKPVSESPLGCSNVLVCTDDVAKVSTTESEKNALLEETEKTEKPVSETLKYAWLEEKEKPSNFLVVGALYRGPKVIKS